MGGQTKARACGRKKQHKSRVSAQEQIAQLQLDLGAAPNEYRPYECPHCGSWHVGHRTRGRQRRQAGS